jgi:hypothetical protein
MRNTLSLDGAALCATLGALDEGTTVGAFTVEATLRACSIVLNSGLVTDRAVVYLERACDGATDWAGTYSSSSGFAV